MKSILKKVAGVALAAVLALGMFSCSNGIAYPVMETAVMETVETPEFSVASGAVNSGTEVTITCATEGAKIYYTTDGNDPTAESTEYANAISITEAVTLKAIAVKDGTVLSKDKTPESDTVAAVIVRAATNAKPALGVGIVHNKSGLTWCTDSAEGYSEIITALNVDTTGGYMDGSDGWEKLKEACSDAESNPANYPAWNYSLTYATTNGLTGDLATGWYLPTVAELDTIYQNKTVVDASLLKAGGSTFGTNFYWSCCQSPSNDVYARELNFNFGSMNGYAKGSSFIYVCSVRAFN